MRLLLVLAGAGVGAPLRYLVDRAIQARHGLRFPWGTFAVNVTGSLILGAVTAGVVEHAAPTSLLFLLGVGFCGALTTYSTFGTETLRLMLDGALLAAATNVVLSVAACVGAAAAGFALASWVG
jgi:CrcB protein